MDTKGGILDGSAKIYFATGLRRSLKTSCFSLGFMASCELMSSALPCDVCFEVNTYANSDIRFSFHGIATVHKCKALSR